MRDVSDGSPFVPLDLGAGEEWGLNLVAPTGDVTLQVDTGGGNWIDVQTVTEAGGHLSRLSNRRLYRVNPANAAAVYLL